MRMNIKVKMNSTRQIIKDHGLDKNGKVTEFLAQRVEKLCQPYVPGSQQLHLRNSGRANEKGIGTIFYPGPYAHYLYKGKLMLAKNGSCWAKFGEKKHYVGKKLNYYGDQKSGPEWDKRMMNDRGKEVCKDVENFIKNGGK